MDADEEPFAANAQTVGIHNSAFQRLVCRARNLMRHRSDARPPGRLSALSVSLPKCEDRKTLKFSTQTSYLMSLRRWFVWLHEEKFVPVNPAEKLQLPKEEKRLPTGSLNADEVESVLNAVDVTTELGIRNRAILETFYSTGIRCGELTALQVYDLQAERGVLTIHQGKGGKDRVVPIGERALRWVQKYQADIRPKLAEKTNTSVLFLSQRGRPFGRNNMSLLVKEYLNAAGIKKRGSCHLFRHSAATLMMENGADLRSLQEFLGHERLNTTQIYTHVSIKRLQDVHRKTHPAEPDQKPDEDKQDQDKRE